ncbi:MAG: TetR/AcrR family transcriptional regulator [Sphingomonadaceae bacterium]
MKLGTIVPRKPKTDEQIRQFRGRIVAAATQLFAERGPANVSMRDIAAAVGVSAMTPYLYFADREALFTAVRVSALTRVTDWLNEAVEGKAPIEASRAISRAYVNFALTEPGMYRLLFDHGFPNGDDSPELTLANERARKSMRSYVESLVDAGILSGDPEMIGMMFWASMHGTIVLQRSGAFGADVDAEALRRLLVKTIFRGLRSSQERQKTPSTSTS